MLQTSFNVHLNGVRLSRMYEQRTAERLECVDLRACVCTRDKVLHNEVK